MIRNIILGASILLLACNGHKNVAVDKELFSTSDNKIKIKVVNESPRWHKKVIIYNNDSSQSVTIGLDSNGIIKWTSFSATGMCTHNVEYYKNGRPKGIVDFDTTTTGEAIYYYENGNKESEGRWENGSQVGVWKSYDTKGKITKIDTLKHVQPID